MKHINHEVGRRLRHQIHHRADHQLIDAGMDNWVYVHVHHMLRRELMLRVQVMLEDRVDLRLRNKIDLLL
jgi:hypothetical protein